MVARGAARLRPARSWSVSGVVFISPAVGEGGGAVLGSSVLRTHALKEQIATSVKTIMARIRDYFPSLLRAQYGVAPNRSLHSLDRPPLTT